MSFSAAQDGPIRGWWVRLRSWLSLIGAVLLVATGCTRRYYRRFADRDVYRIEQTRQSDWRWQLPPRPVEANPASRIGDLHDPDRAPIPHDDPGARPFQVTAGRPLEFHGWKERGTAPVENLNWLECLPRENDGSVLLNARTAMQIALANNRDYQTNIENVYLAALNLTLARFAFFPQIFSTNTEQYAHAGARANETNQLQLFTQDTLNWTFFSGANLLVNFANSLIFSYNGHGFQAVNSGLFINLTQPLLQGAWARNVTQPLSLQERGVLYTVRAFAEYRRQFYVSTVSGYLNLLTQVQGIRNTQNQVESLKRNLDEQEAQVKAGLVDPVSRDTTASQYLSSRSSLLQIEALYQTNLDVYRYTQLGLPADFPLKIDESLLKNFELNDPRLDTLRKDNEELYLGLLQYDGPPGKPVMADAARALLAEYRTLHEVSELIGQELSRWQAQIRDANGRVGSGSGPTEKDERDSLARQVGLVKDLAARFKDSLDALEDNTDNTQEFLETLDTTRQDEAWSRLRQELVSRDFRARLAEQFLIETQARVYLIHINEVDMTVAQAIDTALANRLDLMNSLATVTDYWRNVEYAANQLLPGLNLFYTGSINTPPNHLGIFRFDAHESEHLVGIQFQPPIVRRSQRNAYRSDQIFYQRARRAYMLNHDLIVQTIRADMRALNLNRRQFEINREALLITLRQVELAEYNARNSSSANSGAGQSVGLQLTTALNNLLGAKNGLITNWVQYEISRLNLFRDFDIMNIDANGTWTNDASTASYLDAPVPATPDPLRIGGESLLPGPSPRPDAPGAGAGPPLPPPIDANSPFARPETP